MCAWTASLLTEGSSVYIKSDGLDEMKVSLTGEQAGNGGG